MDPRIVLVADADDDSRFVYSAILRHSGFVVLEARNGAAALELIRKDVPDAVVTELSLPVVDGCELLRRLREQPRTAAIPVLVVTANNQPEMRRKAEAAGCNGFIIMPCSPVDLLQAVHGLLRSNEVPLAYA